MNNLTTIYVVRHGQSVFNTGNHDILDAPLTELGKEQAKKISQKLKDIKFDAVFSSILLRAKQTADILALERDLEVKARELIYERSFYQYARKINRDEEELLNEMRGDLEKLDDKAKMQYKHSKDMESVEEAAIRILNFLREVALAYQGKNVLVISHGNIMRSVLTHLGYAKYNELPEGTIVNTGYFILESDGTDFFVKEVYGVNKPIDAKRIW